MNVTCFLHYTWFSPAYILQSLFQEDDQIKNDKKQRIRDERSKRFQERGESGGTAAEETDDDGEEMDEKEGERGMKIWKDCVGGS